MEQASSDKLLGWISLSLHLQLHPIPARTARTSTSVTHSGTSERRVSVPPPVPHTYSLSMRFRHSSTPNLMPWERVLCSRACATLERSIAISQLPQPAISTISHCAGLAPSPKTGRTSGLGLGARPLTQGPGMPSPNREPLILASIATYTATFPVA